MIRRVELKEVKSVIEMAKRFENETAFVPVDIDHATKMYSGLIGSGKGVMIALFKDDKVVGAIGGICGPDLHYPRTVGIETFWFVIPECRGDGVRLLNFFEQWAKEKGCDYTALVHLADSHPESLKKLYERRGYDLVENHYMRRIV